MACELIQIYYKDEQVPHCYPFAKLYKNEVLTIFFENSVIEKAVIETTADKIAVCSWRLKEKMRWYIGKPRELTQEVLESDYDVLAMTKNTKVHQMLNAADKYHKGFRLVMEVILRKLWIPCPSEVKTPIYQNHFSARTAIYQDYVNRYLSPVMSLMKNDMVVNAMVTQDSGYATLDRTKRDDVDRLRELIGFSFYPLAPFILERLFSIYVHNEKIKVTHL